MSTHPKSAMPTPSKIPQNNLPQTYIHLARQLRNPVTALHYEAWNAGKNIVNKGVVGHYPEAPKWRNQLPKYVYAEDQQNDLAAQGNLGSYYTLCELCLCLSWFMFLYWFAFDRSSLWFLWFLLTIGFIKLVSLIRKEGC